MKAELDQGTDYEAFIAKQKRDAEELCAGLKEVFKDVEPHEITITNYTVSKNSERLQKAVDDFKNRLLHYSKNNPVYNPYVLEQLCEIYDSLLYDFDRDCFFSQKIFGTAQAVLLSSRWLEYYAQGIYHLADKNEAPRRSFICRDSNPPIDIRKLVSSCIGVDSYLSLFEGGLTRRRWGLGLASKNYVGKKTASFQDLLRGQCEFIRTSSSLTASNA